MTEAADRCDGTVPPAMDPLEQALRKHNESLILARLPEGVQPSGLDVASMEAALTFLKLLLSVPLAGVSLYLGSGKVAEEWRKRRNNDEALPLPPDLDEIAERLSAEEITTAEALAVLPDWLQPGSPAHRQLLGLAIDGGQLLDVLQKRGLPGRVAKQIINEARRSL